MAALRSTGWAPRPSSLSDSSSSLPHPHSSVHASIVTPSFPHSRSHSRQCVSVSTSVQATQRHTFPRREQRSNKISDSLLSGASGSPPRLGVHPGRGVGCTTTVAAQAGTGTGDVKRGGGGGVGGGRDGSQLRRNVKGGEGQRPLPLTRKPRRRGRRVRAVATEPLAPAVTGEPKLVASSATAFAPATVANLGPGFDFLGCAVEGLGDHVTAEVRDDLPRGALVISKITGDGGRLSLEAEDNCIGVAAQSTLELLGVSPGGKGTHKGIALSLEKGLPLGSGLGSSAASAAAAAVAVNALFGSPLSKAQLVPAGLRSEAFVSGYHADNVAPSLMGGFVLIRSYQPELEIIPLVYPSESELLFVVVSPAFEAPTRKMRAALPTEISMKSHVANSSQAAALVTAIILGNAPLLGSALASDSIVEPRRAPLIPGMSAVKVAAKAAGAYGCTISGAGPTAVAVTDSAAKAEAIGAEMVKAFREQGKLQAVATVAPLNREGARVLRIE